MNEIDYGGSGFVNKAIALNYDITHGHLLIHRNDEKVILVNMADILQQHTLNYPNSAPLLRNLISQYEEGHISMTSAPFTFNLLEERIILGAVKERHWIRRIQVNADPTASAFLEVADEDILDQTSYLKASTKFIATSYNNRFLIAMNENRVGLFQH